MVQEEFSINAAEKSQSTQTRLQPPSNPATTQAEINLSPNHLKSLYFQNSEY